MTDKSPKINTLQEAEIRRAAEQFVAYHGGDAIKALMEMIVINSQLQQRLEELGDRQDLTILQ